MAQKIVVVEDEPDIANLLAFHLKSNGYDCFVIPVFVMLCCFLV